MEADNTRLNGRISMFTRMIRWLFEIQNAAKGFGRRAMRRLPSPESSQLARLKQALDGRVFGLEEAKQALIDEVAIRMLQPDVAGNVVCLIGPSSVGKRRLVETLARELEKQILVFDCEQPASEFKSADLQKLNYQLGEPPLRTDIEAQNRRQIGPAFQRAMRNQGLNDHIILLENAHTVSAPADVAWLGDALRHSFEMKHAESPLVDDRLLPRPGGAAFLVASARSASRLPGATRRLVVEAHVGGFLPEEKVEILMNHLLDEVLEECGLKRSTIRIHRNTLLYLTQYTTDEGMGNYIHLLKRVLRRCSFHFVQSGRRQELTNDLIASTLGLPPIKDIDRTPRIGVTHAIAAGTDGGEVIPIETLRLPGKGRLIISGVHDTKREFVNLAYSHLTANEKTIGVDVSLYDMHIACKPRSILLNDNAIGLAVYSALYSGVSGRPVRQDIAIGGEITLKGKVLPMPAFGEAVLAACRASFAAVLLPTANAKEYSKLRPAIRRKLQALFVSDVEAAIDELIVIE